MGRRSFSTLMQPNMTKDYYKILNIEVSAKHQDVRKSFFNLAKKYHPDLNTDKRDEDREQAKVQFQEINEAYQVLSNQRMRAQYDQRMGTQAETPVSKKDQDEDLDDFGSDKGPYAGYWSSKSNKF